MIRLEVCEERVPEFTVVENQVTLLVSPAVVVGAPTEAYEGEYEVTPSWKTQTLKTAGKTLEADVEVKPIPADEVSNTSGGKTLIIGGI